MGLRLPSVMSHDFGMVEAPSMERSTFDLSHGYKTTFDAGYLIPFLVEEVLPGDTFNCSVRMLGRMNSFIRPIMDNMFLDVFYFFVPTRLLWSNWERLMGSQDNPRDSIDFEVPYLSGDPLTFAQSSIYDYMGLPTKVEMSGTEQINSLPLRAYNFIYNEWFRDQNLQDSVAFSIDDGPDNIADFNLLRRGKKHDYFTSMLLEPQKGDAQVIPIAGSAPVIGNGESLGLVYGGVDTGLGLYTVNSGQFPGISPVAFNKPVGTPISPTTFSGTNNAPLGVSTNPLESGLIADLSDALSVTVNDLRVSVAYQHVLERDARSGTRYVEQLRARWGVSPRDDRLQRPEYLGGSSERINVTAVPQTSTTNTTTTTARNTQGNLAAYATAQGRSGFMKSFPEYGYVIGLVNLRADITYQQGLRRMWSRSTRFDFATPELMHLGEQPVFQKELYYAEDGATADVVLGYQERYAEYRYHPSTVTGSFRSNYTGTLDSWHLALNFVAPPALDDAFIVDDAPLDRVLAVPSEHHMLFDSYIELKAARCMPVYATPGLERL